MSRLSAVQTNKTLKPARVLIYGIEGVGKSTFGAKAPGAIFITPEGGVDEIPGAVAMPNIKTWNDIRESVKELITGRHDFKTLVLDSADWTEKLCHAHIIGAGEGKGKSIITCNGGYGAGYRESEKLHRELIDDLAALRETRGMNIVVTAHYTVKTVKDPEAVHDYDAFEVKCHEFVSSLWREWVDCILFARFKTYLSKDDDTDKARALGSGERVMYTEKRPAFQAKNRYGLPFEINDVSWESFHQARMSGREANDSEVIKKTIADLQMKVDVGVRAQVQQSVDQVGNDAQKLTVILNRLKTLTAGAA